MSDAVFNEEEYLIANPDVALAIKQGAFISGYKHYVKYGKNEGRSLKSIPSIGTREDKVFHLLNKKGLGLEVGPSHNPIAPKKKGFNVHILDHATAEQLREKYKGHEGYGVKVENIEEVDFVWHGEPYHELIGNTHCYDWIIASHLIEHVPDLILYLQQCEILLKPDGILSLVIPDKRYCFDYFSNAAKRNGNIAWALDGLGGATELLHTISEAKENLKQSHSSSDYIDVHCWRFTPASFRLLISDLQKLGLINLEIKAEFDTTGCEFYVALGKKDEQSTVTSNRLEQLNQIKLENQCP